LPPCPAAGTCDQGNFSLQRFHSDGPYRLRRRVGRINFAKIQLAICETTFCSTPLKPWSLQASQGSPRVWPPSMGNICFFGCDGEFCHQCGNAAYRDTSRSHLGLDWTTSTGMWIVCTAATKRRSNGHFFVVLQTVDVSTTPSGPSEPGSCAATLAADCVP